MTDTKAYCILALTALLVVAAIYVIKTVPIHYGIDITGGKRYVLVAEPSSFYMGNGEPMSREDRYWKMRAAELRLRNWYSSLEEGIRVYREGSDKIIIEIPGSEAKRLEDYSPKTL